MSISSNLERIRNEIADVCARAHRDPATVALMAVSKMHPAEAILEAYAAGQRLFGENRVQEWQSKLPQMGDIFDPKQGSEAARMHLIGPLQSNKTSRAAELFHAVDTLDALKIAERLHTTAQALGKVLPVLVEVKLSPEESKHGLAPEDLPAFLAALRQFDALVPSGLMTVPP